MDIITPARLPYGPPLQGDGPNLDRELTDPTRRLPVPPLLDKEGLGVVSKESCLSNGHCNSCKVALWFPFAGGWAKFEPRTQSLENIIPQLLNMIDNYGMCDRLCW